MEKRALRENIQKLTVLSGEEDEELLELLLLDAEEYVLSYTNRRRLLPALEKTVRDLAVIALNRGGTEGESGRSDGGESYSFDNAPLQIYSILNRYRLAKAGGKTYEDKAGQT